MNKLRLIKEEINKIRTLIQNGNSLNEISSILGKSKTTVYYHFRKIKGRTFNPIILNSNNKVLIGEFIGLFAGDGYLSKEKISFATVSKGLMENITNFLNELQIEYSVNLYKEKRINRKDIYHINVLKNDYNKFMNIIRPRNLKGLYASAGIRIPEC